MNNLQVIDVNEKDTWDSIVKSFSRYDVSYLNGYVNAFFIHGDGKPLLFYYDDGDTRAINVVMLRDIAESQFFCGRIEKGKWFDLSSPYGYGGFLVEGENIDTVNCAYDEYCKQNGFVSEFVRFHLLNDYRNQYSGIIETHMHNIIRTLDLPVEKILMDFEHKVRKNIKKAIKSGIEIIIDPNGKYFQDFKRIYYSTMDRAGANRNFYFTEEFFEAIHQMQGNYIYFHVIYEDKVISTELVLYGSENCYSFLGGTEREYFNIRPNDYLKFEVIKWAKDKGLKRFILGGGYGDNDGIFQYKKSFAPNGIYDFYIGKKIFDNKKYSQLLDIRGYKPEEQTNVKYFPQYRG